MAIILPDGLPAGERLGAEGIEVLHEPRLGEPPLRVGLLNLMPDKPTTEIQFARLLACGRRDVELILMQPATHRARHTPAEHLADFYLPWQAAARAGLDGLIVTGAPVELMPFTEVDYWPELCRILDWARRRVESSVYVCWAAQAALHRFRGIGKQLLPAKRFGVFTHRITAPGSPLAAGLPARFPVPVSRHTESLADEIDRDVGMVPVAISEDAGLCLVEDADNRAVYAFNHFEYDADTLAREYRRDLAAGEAVRLPQNYFPGDDPNAAPVNSWRAVAMQLFENWLGQLEGLEFEDARRPVEQPAERQSIPGV